MIRVAPDFSQSGVAVTMLRVRHAIISFEKNWQRYVLKNQQELPNSKRRLAIQQEQGVTGTRRPAVINLTSQEVLKRPAPPARSGVWRRKRQQAGRMDRQI
jgi:hypothetical protein